jgi:outer membrane protein TolC
MPAFVSVFAPASGRAGLWCAAVLCAAPAWAEPFALRAADPATPVAAATTTPAPPAPALAQPLELPTDIDRARAIWQQANARVAEFGRGHIDILRWEAQNPGSALPASPVPPVAPTPASNEPVFDGAQALRLSLRQRPDVFAHAGMNTLERAEVQRAYVAHAQAVDSAWAETVTARHSLRLLGEALSAAHTGVALGQRMVQAGNWSQAKLLREQLSEAAAQQAVARAQQAQTRADEQLARLLGVWDSARLQALLQRLPPALPALPESLAMSAAPMAGPDLHSGHTAPAAIAPTDAEAAALRSHPTLAAQRTDTRRLLAAVPAEQQTRWAQAVDEALDQHNAQSPNPALGSTAPWSAAPWSAPHISNLPMLHDHALQRAVQAESRLLQAAAERRSMAREAWAQLQAAHAHALHAQNVLVPLHTTLEQETLLRYNGMLQSTWDLLAQARERMAAVDAAHQARRDFWLAHTAWQALLAGGDYQSPGNSSAPAGGASPAPKGH